MESLGKSFGVKQERLRLLPLDVSLQTRAPTKTLVSKCSSLSLSWRGVPCYHCLCDRPRQDAIPDSVTTMSSLEILRGDLPLSVFEFFECCGSGCHNHFRNTPAPVCPAPFCSLWTSFNGRQDTARFTFKQKLCFVRKAMTLRRTACGSK